MQAKTKFSFLAGFFAAALSLGLAAPAAQAQETNAAPAASAAPKAAAPQSSGKRYFVEFRSRSALSYGHTFLVHGRLNAQGQVGQVTKDQVVGLHPFSESSVPWTIGHVVPVKAEHGFSDGDIEDEYITARYRVLLTEAEYRNARAVMQRLIADHPMWHAVLYNCASFVRDVAKGMGLKAGSHLQYPDDFIKELAALNGGRAVLLQDTQPKRAAKPASAAAAKPAAAKPAAAKPAAKPAADPNAPSATSPAPKPAAAKPAAKRTASAPAAQPEAVRQ